MPDSIPPASTGDISIYSAARQVQVTEKAATSPKSTSAGVPASPPAEVLRALDGAARVDQELRTRGLTVSFDVQPRGDVRVRIVNGGGAVLHDLAPAVALDALGGDRSIDDLTR